MNSECITDLCGDGKLFRSMGDSLKTRLKTSDASAEIKGKGVVHISVSSDKGKKVLEYKDTLYVPELRTNLISVAKITNKGHEVTFRQNDAYIRD